MIRTTNRRAVKHIAAMEDFRNGEQTFWGQAVAGRVPPCYGSLPLSDVATLLKTPGVQYIVYSYNTPIAWVDRNGTWIVPYTKYSVTTSKHQGLVNYAISLSAKESERV